MQIPKEARRNARELFEAALKSQETKNSVTF
jgi:hypothetical protein